MRVWLPPPTSARRSSGCAATSRGPRWRLGGSRSPPRGWCVTRSRPRTATAPRTSTLRHWRSQFASHLRGLGV